MLNALAGAVPPRERVISCEEVFELRPAVRDWVAMQTRQANLEGTGEISLRRLVKEALRMRPDRLLVGEVREAEALDLLIALNSGVPAMCTIHAQLGARGARQAVHAAPARGRYLVGVHARLACPSRTAWRPVCRVVGGHPRGVFDDAEVAQVPVQPIRATSTGRRSYTVLGPDDLPIAPVESFLAHLDHLNYSPNTVKAYAHDLDDLFGWLARSHEQWWSLQVGDVGEWIAWLRLPRRLRGTGVPVLPTVASEVSERTLQRKLAAVSSFYEYHRRSDPRVSLTLSRWTAGARRGGFKQFLAHTERGSMRRQIKLRGVLDPAPQVISREDLAALLDACTRLRDRFLLTLLFETGMRVGEALGLRHSDLNVARARVDVEPRANANDARVKGWKPRTVPVNLELFPLYARYMDEEYGGLDSDYVFVNLWGGQVGHAMSYTGLRSLVLRLRRATGLDTFTPHHLRHTYATELIRRGTDWAVVQRLLGHASIQTTLNIYGHLTAADARAALVAAGWFDKSWASTSQESR